MNGWPCYRTTINPGGVALSNSIALHHPGCESAVVLQVPIAFVNGEQINETKDIIATLRCAVATGPSA